ncbi:MAG: thioesterase [Candidatus Thermoplasmatota archaeon]|jgi:acyl-ACP thioesterase|nr:thioesterase [Candidatus Thermoplasmatota archaeon]
MTAPIEHRMTFTVRTYDIGSKGHIQMHSLMQYLQEAASTHANNIGVGFDWMRSRGYYWVLVNLRVEFERVPFYGDTVEIITYPSGMDLLKAFREFIGTDGAGRPLFKASSEWMVLDRATKSVKEMSELKFDFPFRTERALGPFQRLRPQKDYEGVYELVVPHSSIDMNSHVNNCEYVRWGTDALWKYDPKGHDVKKLHITFNAEVKEAEHIMLSGSRTNEGTVSIKGARATDSKIAFLMEVS